MLKIELRARKDGKEHVISFYKEPGKDRCDRLGSEITGHNLVRAVRAKRMLECNRAKLAWAYDDREAYSFYITVAGKTNWTMYWDSAVKQVLDELGKGNIDVEDWEVNKRLAASADEFLPVAIETTPLWPPSAGNFFYAVFQDITLKRSLQAENTLELYTEKDFRENFVKKGECLARYRGKPVVGPGCMSQDELLDLIAIGGPMCVSFPESRYGFFAEPHTPLGDITRRGYILNGEVPDAFAFEVSKISK